jgi:hypothetical protein
VQANITGDPEDPDFEIPVIIERLHLRLEPGTVTRAGSGNPALLLQRHLGGIIQYVSAEGTMVNASAAENILFVDIDGPYAVVRRSYTDVNLTSRYDTGLLGYRIYDSGAIEDSYTTGSGSVTGNAYSAIGGIIAAITPSTYETSHTVTRNYVTGNLGGGIGLVQGIAQLPSSGWNSYTRVTDNLVLSGRLYGSSSMEYYVSRIAPTPPITPTTVFGNNYAYKDMIVENANGGNHYKSIVNNGDNASSEDGKNVDVSELTKDFFTNDLGWSEEVWDFEFDEPGRSWKLPIIKGYREQEQKLRCLPAHLRSDPSYTTDYPHCI